MSWREKRWTYACGSCGGAYCQRVFKDEGSKALFYDNHACRCPGCGSVRPRLESVGEFRVPEGLLIASKERSAS